VVGTLCHELKRQNAAVLNAMQRKESLTVLNGRSHSSFHTRMLSRFDMDIGQWIIIIGGTGSIGFFIYGCTRMFTDKKKRGRGIRRGYRQ